MVSKIILSKITSYKMQDPQCYQSYKTRDKEAGSYLPEQEVAPLYY